MITGCLRITKESIFTGLNNLKMVSILSNIYDEYFGFTQKETEALLDEYDRADKMEIMKEWYNGYRFGNAESIIPGVYLIFLMRFGKMQEPCRCRIGRIQARMILLKAL